MTSLIKFFSELLNDSPKDINLYKQALTHRSYLNEAKDRSLKSYERLEFLGDSILSYFVSEKIFNSFPKSPEGDLTNLRSTIVKTESFAEIAKNLGLNEFLFLSKGEEDSGGKNNTSILADCFEATVAAIYFDQGLEKTKEFLNRIFTPLIKNAISKKTLKDYKSLLQELCQEKIQLSPNYSVIKEEGPDHKKVFTIEVKVNGKSYGKGSGKSKQEAEQQAAQKALEIWNK